MKTKNPEKAYLYWAGSNPPKDFEIINGEYYQSPHFTLEYEFFLEFKPEKIWWDEFIRSNKLETDCQTEDWSKFTKLPEWFNPSSNSLIYSKNNQFDRSRYFINPKTGICYIYETVGM